MAKTCASHKVLGLATVVSAALLLGGAPAVSAEPPSRYAYAFDDRDKDRKEWEKRADEREREWDKRQAEQERERDKRDAEREREWRKRQAERARERDKDDREWGKDRRERSNRNWNGRDADWSRNWSRDRRPQVQIRPVNRNSSDYDRDGIPNNRDWDMDGDRVANNRDRYPRDRSRR